VKIADKKELGTTLRRSSPIISRAPGMVYFSGKPAPLHTKQNHMTFSVQVKVMPLKELLDPQGKAVMSGLESLGLKNVSDVRIGKNISLQVEAGSAAEARQIAEEAGRKLLANPVMEYFEIAVN
jgi:phosphoribosylformylglycinamidine synthase